MFTTTLPADRRDLLCLLLDNLADAAPTEQGRPGEPVYLDERSRADYLQGAADMLTFLGLLERTADGAAARPVSPLAGCVLRQLNDLLSLDRPLVEGWSRTGLSLLEDRRHPFGRAPDFAAALEARRYEVLPHAAPVREVVAAAAIIVRRDELGDLRFLLTHDADARSWQLPGGRLERGDASPQAALLRELTEELGFDLLRGLSGITLRQLPPCVIERDSPTYGVRTITRFHLFLIEWLRSFPLRGVNRWFTREELQQGVARDGLRIAAEPLLYTLERDLSVAPEARADRPSLC